MTRQALNGGGWINLETAKKYTEERDFDGRNMISVNTHSQWEHECLYQSAGGAYVLHSWSQYQGSHDTWQRLSLTEAVAWLVRNDYEPATKDEETIAAQLEV